MIETIENSLGLKLPLEIKELYKNIALFNNVRFLFDTRELGSHWLLNASYFLIQPSEVNTEDREDYYINHHYASTNENILTSINCKVLKSIKKYWSENKVFVFAWSNDVIEKDASLVYVLNDDDTVKGLYVHSLNFVEEKVFIGENLKDFFNLKLPVLFENDNYSFPLLNQKLTESYKDVLKKEFKIFDIESVDDVLDYRYVIETLVKLSGGKFSPEIHSLTEKDSKRLINISLSGREFSYELEGDTDCIDLKLFNVINDSLLEIGFKRKKFIVFSESSFGQEIGVSFIGKSLQKQLLDMKTLTLL